MQYKVLQWTWHSDTPANMTLSIIPITCVLTLIYYYADAYPLQYRKHKITTEPVASPCFDVHTYVLNHPHSIIK